MRGPTYFRPAHLPIPCIIGLALITFFACGSREKESLDLSGPAAAKVHPELRRTASQMLTANQGDSLLSVLVRVHEATDRTALEKSGMRVDSVVGDVVTGWITPRTIADLAALDQVIQIEPARKLDIK